MPSVGAGAIHPICFWTVRAYKRAFLAGYASATSKLCEPPETCITTGVRPCVGRTELPGPLPFRPKCGSASDIEGLQRRGGAVCRQSQRAITWWCFTPNRTSDPPIFMGDIEGTVENATGESQADGVGLRPRRTRLEIPVGRAIPSPARTVRRNMPGTASPFRRRPRAGSSCSTLRQRAAREHSDGKLVFEGAFAEPGEPGPQGPPFRSFGDAYYTYQILIDLKVDEGWAIKTETHPRFYTDRTGTVRSRYRP